MVNWSSGFSLNGALLRLKPGLRFFHNSFIRLMRWREPNVFCACGRVEETLFWLSFSSYTKRGTKKEITYRSAEGENHLVMDDRIPRIIEDCYTFAVKVVYPLYCHAQTRDTVDAYAVRIRQCNRVQIYINSLYFERRIGNGAGCCSATAPLLMVYGVCNPAV